MKILLCDDEGNLLDEHTMDMDTSRVGPGFIKDWLDDIMGDRSSMRIIGRGKWESAKGEMASDRNSKPDSARELSFGIDIDGVDIRILEKNLREMSESDLMRFIEEQAGWRLRRYNIAYTVDDLKGFLNIFIP
jgi:hypothetical protein